MDKYEYKDIKTIIKDLKKGNIEEKIFIIKYYLMTLIKCLFSFGVTHKITIDCKNMFKEIMDIFEEEIMLCNYILDNKKKIDYIEAGKFIEKLEQLNDDTILYYVDYFDGVISASETKQEFRAHKPKKEFVSLIDTDNYRKELFGLTLNFDMIKKYLDYPDDFWDYVIPKVRIVDEYSKMNYEVIMNIKDNVLKDIRVIVPEITNLLSALINIHEFKHAYDLYNMLGKEVPLDTDFYEESAKALEDEFKNKYLMKLIK